MAGIDFVSCICWLYARPGFAAAGRSIRISASTTVEAVTRSLKKRRARFADERPLRDRVSKAL